MKKVAFIIASLVLVCGSLHADSIQMQELNWYTYSLTFSFPGNFQFDATFNSPVGPIRWDIGGGAFAPGPFTSPQGFDGLGLNISLLGGGVGDSVQYPLGTNVFWDQDQEDWYSDYEGVETQWQGYGWVDVDISGNGITGNAFITVPDEVFPDFPDRSVVLYNVRPPIPGAPDSSNLLADVTAVSVFLALGFGTRRRANSFCDAGGFS